MSARTKATLTVLVLLALALALAGGGATPFDTTPALIIMLHEVKHGPLPPYAIGAANELTAAGREVRMVDDDVTDGLGEVPGWLKPALETGRVIMGGATDDAQKDDALILLKGERVVKAVKMPPTRPEIVEACK